MLSLKNIGFLVDILVHDRLLIRAHQLQSIPFFLGLKKVT